MVKHLAIAESAKKPGTTRTRGGVRSLPKQNGATMNGHFPLDTAQLAAATERANDPTTGALTYLAEMNPHLNFRDLAPVTEQFVAGYSQMTLLGLPADTVGTALMGATLRFYGAFDMTEQLPGLLRAVADLLEVPVEEQ